MNHSQVEAIIERWMSDESFRVSMRAAPMETISREGYVLTEEERATLSQMDLSLSDEELCQRASFGT